MTWLTSETELEIAKATQKQEEELRQRMSEQEEELQAITKKYGVLCNFYKVISVSYSPGRYQEERKAHDGDIAERFESYIAEAKERGATHREHVEAQFHWKLQNLRELAKLKSKHRKKMSVRFQRRVRDYCAALEEWAGKVHEQRAALKTAQSEVMREAEQERHELKMKQVKKSLHEQSKKVKEDFFRIEAEIKKKMEARVDELKGQNWPEKKEMKAEIQKVTDMFKRDEKDRKEWFEKHVKQSLEKDLDGLAQYQREEMAVLEKNLTSTIDKEKKALEKEVRELHERTEKRLAELTVKHEYERLRDKYDLQVAENGNTFPFNEFPCGKAYPRGGVAA